MNKSIFGLFLLLVSFEQARAYDIQIKTLPEEYFLFRPVGEKTNPGGGKANPAARKAREAKMKASIDEMSADVKKYKLKHGDGRLTVVDFKFNLIVMNGIPVSGPNLAAVPKEKLKLRPAGKYIMLTFSGKKNELEKALEEVRLYIVKNKIKPIGNYMYEYFKKPTDPWIFMSPVE